MPPKASAPVTPEPSCPVTTSDCVVKAVASTLTLLVVAPGVFVPLSW